MANRLHALFLSTALIATVASSSAWAADAVQAPATLGGIYFSGDFVYAFRSTSGGGDALIVPTGGPGNILTAGQFETKGASGADVRLGFMGDTYGIEGRFFGGFNWKDDVALGAVGNVRIGSFSNFGATNLDTSISSKLNTAELNARAALMPDLTVFAGVRYMNLDDAFQGDIAFPAFTAVYEWRAHTTGWGPQVGVEGKFKLADSANYEWAYLKGDARIGYLFTSAQNDFSLRPSTGGLFEAHGKDKGGTVAAELGVTLGHDFTPNFGIEAGYRALLVPKVVTGTGLLANATATSTNISSDEPTNRLLVQAFTIGAHLKF